MLGREDFVKRVFVRAREHLSLKAHSFCMVFKCKILPKINQLTEDEMSPLPQTPSPPAQSEPDAQESPTSPASSLPARAHPHGSAEMW